MKKIFLMLCIFVLSTIASAQCSMDIDNKGVFTSIQLINDVVVIDTLAINIKGREITIDYRGHTERTLINILEFIQIDNESCLLMDFIFNKNHFTLVQYALTFNKIGVITGYSTDDEDADTVTITTYTKI